MTKDPAFDLDIFPPAPNVFIQWKGTNVCMDFHCECGEHLHFDGYFAYAVKCPSCLVAWEMPSRLFPRKLPANYAGIVQALETDEDRRA